MNGRAVKPYRLLNTPLSSEREVRLPVDEGSLVHAILKMTDDHGVGEALFQCPALFLFFCAHFSQRQGRAPSSVQEFLDWANESGIDLIEKELDEQVSRKGPKWHARFLELQSGLQLTGSNKRLRIQLRELLLLIPKVGLKSAKAWLKETVGKALAPREFKTCKLRLASDQQNVSLAEPVLALVKRDRETTTEFETRLRDEKLSAMKELAYGASHEINNPLANIATRAQVLISNEPNPERRRKLAVIHQQAMRAHEMISDMMLFAHPPQTKFELTDVFEWIKQVVAEMRREIRACGALVDIRRYPNVEKAWIDPTQFAVLLKALINNSLESFESGPEQESKKIIVRLWSDTEQGLVVSVTDNGPGVSDAATNHMFDPFYSGREAGRGLGFGLSKAWRIAQLHRGNLVWEREFEGGAQFTFRFPKVQKCGSRIDKASAA